MKPRQSAHDSDRGRSFRRSTANTAGAILCVEIDPELALKRQQIGYLEHIERARVAKPPISVVHVANSSDVYPELVRRGATPDLVTDQTTAHDRVRADGLFVRRGGLRASRTLLARTNVPFEGLPARIAWLELAHVVRTDVALVVNALVAKGDSIAFSATSQRRRNGASTITTERMKDVSDAVGAAVARPGPTTGRSASCAKSIQVTRKRWTRLSNALRLIDNFCFRQLNYGQAVEVRQVRRLPAR